MKSAHTYTYAETAAAGGRGTAIRHRRSASQTLFLITEGKFSRFTSGTQLAAPRNAPPIYDDGAKISIFFETCSIVG